MARRLTIDIWSDVMCPWCLVGYGKLQKGLALLDGEIEADIRWHAFELNPDMPAEGEERSAHIARKYGRTLEQARGVQDQMRTAAQDAGVSLDYSGDGDPPPAMMWNTFDAHKLLVWALESTGPEAQNRLKLALFDAHFGQRRNLGDHDVLVDIAVGAGLDREAAAAALASNELAAHVRAEEQAAYDMNITGVPAMLIEGKYLIPGAQEPEVYANALRRVAVKVGA
ncbi:DsbA family oxidoreductase [Allopontixanthobacter sediminis]|uniref:DsbA family oxidoreductase n=1 Tax=Allopontixanthobacter sediminis TaxID=1689985 RepID=A0A845AW16_9SPHN|nr:DsbA family oxidoreductase [Allopontixanthobacter sediminis]MXP43211.1 DsbA family oxidoreductase [Allopontixanthobacter sediminis]